LSDPYHFQSCNNFALLEQPERKLHSIIARAEKRIDVESKRAEDKVRLRNKPQKDFDFYEIVEPWDEYKVGDRKFAEVGLRNLANRARERFFFTLAAEETLSALVGPNTQEKLSRLRYVDKSGSTRSYLYVENDEVKVYPPLLFSFMQGIQVSRVRRCEICKDYFWAGRKDRKVCSPSCGATKRKRKERKRNLERKLDIRRGRRRKEK
jgi:rubrerythrin